MRIFTNSSKNGLENKQGKHIDVDATAEVEIKRTNNSKKTS